LLSARRRKLFLGLGGATFVIGIVLLSFGVYSALSSDDGTPTSDAPVVRVSDILTPTPAPAGTTTAATVTPTPLPPFGDESYKMVIDKIGVDAPVRTFGLDDQQVPEIPTGPDAAQVVAWYDFTANPGTGSNAVFAGHVTWYGPAVFYSLTDLTLGDEIKLDGADGTELTYKVSNIFRVLSTDPDARALMLGTSQDIMTILTCDGVFTPDPNNHVEGGDYDHRLVIRADLISVTPGTGAAGAG
jgi:LPXTG-site transpeptidase (sortase) family protein